MQKKVVQKLLALLSKDSNKNKSYPESKRWRSINRFVHSLGNCTFLICRAFIFLFVIAVLFIIVVVLFIIAVYIYIYIDTIILLILESFLQ
ncbi:MAG: hypothetical protein LBL82_07810 [Oscillospiraceae bacterium]|jgi:hypothetical protein|nr:hypothetical protein [Oscillospiraceae bacterium]